MKRFLLSLMVSSVFLSGAIFAATTELITDGTNDIPVKDTGDAFSANEFNSIIDLLRGWSRDDNNTFLDQTDDKVGINGVTAPTEALEVNGRVKATYFLGDGSLLTGIDTGYWVQTGDDINYADGNVGIGVANPEGTLSIADTGSTGPAILVSGATSSEGDLTWLQGENFNIGEWDSGADTFTEHMRIEAGGNVGIGITSPRSALDVLGGNGTQLSLDNGGERFTQIDLRNGGTAQAFIAYDEVDEMLAIGGQGSNSDFDAISFRPSGTADDVVITRDGDVGIGTTSPGGALHVVGAGIFGNTDSSVPANGGRVLQVYTGNNANVDAGIDITRGAAYGVAQNQFSLHLKSTGAGVYRGAIGFSGSDTPVETMTFLASGNVGIGTTSPNARLAVDSGSENAPAWSIVSGGNAVLDVMATNTNGFDAVVRTFNGRDLVFEPASSNVGINTRTPAYDLDVTGDVNFTGTLYQNGAEFSGGKFIDGTTAVNAVYTAGNVGIGTATPGVLFEVDGVAEVGTNENLSPNSSADGYLRFDGANYTGYVTMDGTGMYLGHNSGSRNLSLQTLSTDRLVIDADGDVNVDGNFNIGPNASNLGNVVVNIDKHFNVDDTTYQTYSYTTQTSPALTADRHSYGAYYHLVNNKTESGSNDSDASGVRGYVRTTGTNTYRQNYGGSFEARNESTAASGLGSLYGVYGLARSHSLSGTVPLAVGSYGLSQGRSGANTATTTDARGVYGLTQAYNTDMTYAYGTYGYVLTNNSYDGDIANAYGARGYVYHDSDDGGDITGATGGYFSVAKRSTAPLMTATTGVYAAATGGTTNYGGLFYANNSAGVNNYGIYVDASNASGNNIGIYGYAGDWLLHDPAGQVGLRDTTPDLDLVLDVEGKIGADQYCDENGANCIAAEDLGGGLWTEAGVGANAVAKYTGSASANRNLSAGSTSASFAPGFDDGWLLLDHEGYNGSTGSQYPNPQSGVLWAALASDQVLRHGHYMGLVKDVASTAGTTAYRLDFGTIATADSTTTSSQTETFDPSMTIDGGGNVGIGSTIPAEKLEVVGKLNLTSGAGVARTSLDFAYSGPGLNIINKDNTPVSFWTTNTKRMTIDWDGEVGIGTTAPAYNLDIEGVTNYPAQLRLRGSGAGSTNAELILSATNSSNYRGLGVFMHDEGGDTEWYAGTPYAAADQYQIGRKASTASHDSGVANTANAFLTVKNDGDVGIGNIAPDYKLDINDDGASGAGLRVTGGGSGQPIAVFQRDVGSTGSMVISSSGGQPQFYLNGGGNTFAVGVGGGSFRVSDNSTIGTNDRFIIDSAGDVGIGTSAPLNPLHITRANKLGSTFTGAIQGEGIRVDQSAYTSGNYMSLLEGAYGSGNAAPNVRIGALYTGGGSTLSFGTSNSYGTGITNQALNIGPTGNVGVGVVSPNYDLDVAGDINFTGNLLKNGTAFTSGKFVDGTDTDDAVYTAGDVGIGTTTPEATFQVTGGSDASLSDGSGYVLVGNESGENIVMDNNEIVARNNGATSTLYIQESSSYGDTEIGGRTAVGQNASVDTSYATLQVEDYPAEDATTRQIYSSITATSPALTADRTTHGVQVDIVNNKTENGSFDSDANGLWGRTRTNGTNTYRYNRGVYGEARNDSTAGSGLGTLYGVQGTAYPNQASGNVPYAYGVYGFHQGDTTAGSTATVSHGGGVVGSGYAYNADVSNMYGTYGAAATTNGYSGNITNAYGARGYVSHDSDDGATMTNAYGGYFTVRKRTGASNINSAVGVYSNIDGATTAYGATIYADDSTATNNYGVYIEAENASSGNYALYVQAGDIAFPSGSTIRTISGEMACAAGEIMTGFNTGGIKCRPLADVIAEMGIVYQ